MLDDKQLINESQVKRTMQQLNALKSQSNFTQVRDTSLEHLIHQISPVEI